jgi:hypothetical protein
VATCGGNVPLSPDGQHMALNLMFGGTEVLMDSASALGERRFPTLLDLAMMKDIGYEL